MKFVWIRLPTLYKKDRPVCAVNKSFKHILVVGDEYSPYPLTHAVKSTTVTK